MLKWFWIDTNVNKENWTFWNLSRLFDESWNLLLNQSNLFVHLSLMNNLSGGHLFRLCVTRRLFCTKAAQGQHSPRFSFPVSSCLTSRQSVFGSSSRTVSVFSQLNCSKSEVPSDTSATPSPSNSKNENPFSKTESENPVLEFL